MKNFASVLIFTFFAVNLCFGQETYTYSQPKTLDDGWKTNNLKSQNVNTTRIYKLFNQLKSRKNKIHSVLLVKDNQLIIEEYFKGYSVNKQHDMRSVTKSISSILMGIAIDKGFIESIDDPFSKYLKNLQPRKNLDDRKKKIAIRHLLTMSSGLDCNDWDKKSKGREDRIFKKKNWLQHFVDLPMINDPGKVSTYCTMGQTLARQIIVKQSGLTVDKFASKYLFDPLGITNFSLGHTSKKEVLSSGKRLYMTPRDMAKIGQLMLNKGKWNGKQIVSEQWIEESTSAKTKITNLDYGYLWWNLPFSINGKKIKIIAATGNGGQYIMVYPELNMVAVFTGGAYNSQEDKLPFAIMKDIFLPTFVKTNN